MKKAILKLVLPAAGFALLLPGHAFALSGIFGIGNIAGRAIGWILFVVNFVIAYILGAFLAFFAACANLFLQLNKNIGSSSVVQTGLSVSMSLADIFFVVAFFYITIRWMLGLIGVNEQNAFIRLVIALILVNFLPSPVLTTLEGGFYRFSNFFMENASPRLDDTPGSGFVGGDAGTGFVGALVSAFQPQAMFITKSTVTGSSVDTGSLGFVANESSGGLSDVIKPLVGIVVTIIYMLVVALIMLVLTVMLAIRYVVMTILYIFIPFVVIAWIFPAFRHIWRSWWNSFIRWLAYPSIVLLGLYLSIMAAQFMGNSSDKTFEALSNKEKLLDGPAKYISKEENDPSRGIIMQVMEPIMQGIVIIGLAIGGLIAADKLSIHMSEAAMVAGEAAAGHATKIMSGGGRARRLMSRLNWRSAASTRAPLRPPIMMPSQRGGLTAGALVPQKSTAATTGSATINRINSTASATALDAKLSRQLKAATALYERAATPGEKEAARAAMDRIKSRMAAGNVAPTNVQGNISQMQQSVQKTETGSSAPSANSENLVGGSQNAKVVPIDLARLRHQTQSVAGNDTAKPISNKGIAGQLAPHPVIPIDSRSNSMASSATAVDNKKQRVALWQKYDSLEKLPPNSLAGAIASSPTLTERVSGTYASTTQLNRPTATTEKTSTPPPTLSPNVASATPPGSLAAPTTSVPNAPSDTIHRIRNIKEDPDFLEIFKETEPNKYSEARFLDLDPDYVHNLSAQDKFIKKHPDKARQYAKWNLLRYSPSTVEAAIKYEEALIKYQKEREARALKVDQNTPKPTPATPPVPKPALAPPPIPSSDHAELNRAEHRKTPQNTLAESIIIKIPPPAADNNKLFGEQPPSAKAA